MEAASICRKHQLSNPAEGSAAAEHAVGAQAGENAPGSERGPLGALPVPYCGTQLGDPIRAEARRWFAVYTTPRHEKQVRRHFELRHIECFLPLYRAVRRWKNGCVMQLELPLFPSYIFVRIGRSERVPVLEVPGVWAIVGSGREPAPLPDFDIESLRSGLEQRKAEPCPYLVVGERARIESGALAGMEGVLVRRKNNLRIVLSLELVRQSIAVEIDMADVRPLASPSAEFGRPARKTTCWERRRAA